MLPILFKDTSRAQNDRPHGKVVSFHLWCHIIMSSSFHLITEFVVKHYELVLLLIFVKAHTAIVDISKTTYEGYRLTDHQSDSVKPL